MLQRLTEDYEYSSILDQAAKFTDPAQQLAYVAAFTVSSYATTACRSLEYFYKTYSTLGAKFIEPGGLKKMLMGNLFYHVN